MKISSICWVVVVAGVAGTLICAGTEKLPKGAFPLMIGFQAFAVLGNGLATRQSKHDFPWFLGAALVECVMFGGDVVKLQALEGASSPMLLGAFGVQVLGFLAGGGQLAMQNPALTKPPRPETPRDDKPAPEGAEKKDE